MYMYICTYYTLTYVYMCICIYVPIFLLFSNSFEATQRNALICCSLHFIPLLIRPCAASRPHIHWLTHTNAYIQVYTHTYLYTYMCIHMYVCRGTPLCYGRSTCLHILYLWDTCCAPAPLPLPLPQFTTRPFALGILQPRLHTLYSVPHCDLDLDAGLVSVSVSYSAVAFGFVVRHARFVWSS